MNSTLPNPLPDDPLTLLTTWLAEARAAAAQPNPNAMVLATVDAQGQPSARVVLCKGIDPGRGTLTFFTNYESHKGRELSANPRAAVVFHWDHAHRQARAEGHTERLPDADNDAYFRTRPWQSRLGAWASHQSQPVESRDALVSAVTAAARRFALPYDGPGTPEPSGDFDLPTPTELGRIPVARRGRRTLGRRQVSTPRTRPLDPQLRPRPTPLDRHPPPALIP